MRTLLLLEDGHCLRDQALDICSGAGVHEKQDFRATSLETLRQMVAAGVGITLLPELAGRGAYGAARGVVIRPFAKPCRLAPSAPCGANRARVRAVILALSQTDRGARAVSSAAVRSCVLRRARARCEN